METSYSQVCSQGTENLMAHMKTCFNYQNYVGSHDIDTKSAKTSELIAVDKSRDHKPIRGEL